MPNGKISWKIIERVRTTISRFNMFPEGGAVVVGVSGGCDSVALLTILRALSREYSLKPVIAHVNYGLRGDESDRDEELVKLMAIKGGERIEVLKVEKQVWENAQSKQAIARKIRYSFLRKVAERAGAQRIAVGHTLDDQAETVLMKILTGTSPKGMTAILPASRDTVRPLIEITREEIEEFLRGEGIEWRDDSSNIENMYLRNRIRNQLMPLIKKEINPQAPTLLAHLAEVSREEESFMEEAVTSAWERCIVLHGNDEIHFDVNDLSGEHRALRARVIAKALRTLKKEEARFSRRHVESILELAEGRTPSGTLDLPSGIISERRYGRLIISYGARKEILPYEVKILVPGTTEIKDAQLIVETAIVEIDRENVQSLRKNALAAIFDPELAKTDLVIRSFRPGDRFNPKGMKGSKKLQDFFTDMKVPRRERLKIPLLCSDGKVIWIAGMRLAEGTAPGHDSEKVLFIEIKFLS